jgi:hypothetical protein
MNRAAQELEFFRKYNGEFSPLSAGDRAGFVTIDGEFPGTVRVDWAPTKFPSYDLQFTPDYDPNLTLLFHRTMFRAHTILDHIADV